ncbi:Putative serine aminopeptidase, S33, alpha/Beta hydrolase [Septoria linicola]|uniref:Serine aminopeptidase, S33, alpha/Beta hydrolase n=1 Tax=Septoria linicola TaxID=215465 RepID=A0A9Q9AKN3_9PEZI|nr:Putative serine aminopeptidase, S33, alpha/Beta hydrolase [Septoria linicola]
MSTVEVPGVSAIEGSLVTDDNVSLYTRTWSCPEETLKARLVFVHGFSDHCNFYGILFPTLAKQGIKTYAYDQRGWGRSVKQQSDKGNTGNTERILGDLTCFLKQILDHETEKELPLYLMGHSMGGGEVLHYAANGPRDITSRIRGYLCEAPFIALHEESRPWKPTVVLGRLASKIVPQRQMVQKLDAKKLCRDADVVKEWEDDELCHDTGTLECLAAMLDRAAELEEGKAVIKEGSGEGGKTRLWVGFGTGDYVLSYGSCEKWFKGLKIEDKEFRAYEGWTHKLHSEPGDDKKMFAADVSKWILDRSGPLSGLAVKPRL